MPMKQQQCDSRSGIRFLFVSLFALTLLLAGCSSSDDESADETSTPAADESGTTADNDAAEDESEAAATDSEAAAESTGTATLTVGTESFTFQASMCITSSDTNIVSGPGVEDATQELAHLEFSAEDLDGQMNGVIQVHRGSDENVNTDNYLYSFFGQGDDSEFTLNSSGDGFDLQAEFTDFDSGDDLGVGLISVTCE